MNDPRTSASPSAGQSQQQQQSGEAQRAPGSAHGADTPRIERSKQPEAPRPLTDWASI